MIEDLVVDHDINWACCMQGECTGICLPASDRCWAHADKSERDAETRRLGQGGILDARGVPFTRALLDDLLAAAPKDEQGHTVLESANFAYASFRGETKFDTVTFRDVADFSGATFNGPASFTWATFERSVNFRGAGFQGEAGFGDVIVEQDAIFTAAHFEQARAIGPLLAGKELMLDETRFTQPVRIEAVTPELVCRRAQFLAGVQFRLRWASVLLDDTDFAARSMLTGIPVASGGLMQAEQRFAEGWREQQSKQLGRLQANPKASGWPLGRPRPDPGRPWLLSLQRANVAGLGLGGVDLADCRFAGAHNLDKLRLEPDVNFALAPSRPSWDRRQVIAEERTWRCQQGPHGWTAPPQHKRVGLSALPPGQIAGIYRALRKGREDNSDGPGAADFYYGEMEMRRHARDSYSRSQWHNNAVSASRGRAERSILTAYWLTSGYGLRAWRAFACLAALVAGFAAAFHLIGFTRPPEPASYWTSLTYAFRATISLTDTQVTLNAWGELLQALLRVSGPVFLGLALLALRGRVKR